MTGLPNDIKGQNPFKVPEGFFEKSKEDFLKNINIATDDGQPESQVLYDQNVQIDKWTPEKTSDIRRSIYRVASVAAAIALVIIVWKIGPVKSDQNVGFLLDITSEEAYAYVQAHESDFLPLIDHELANSITEDDFIKLDFDDNDQFLLDEILEDIDLIDIQEL